MTATDIAESAAELARARPQTFDVLVALDKVPHRDLAEPLPNWLDKGKVGAWLREHGHDTAGFRTGGGFLYQLQALDPLGAAAQARQLLDRMTARSEFLRGRRGGVVPLPYIWVAGYDFPRTARTPGPRR
ncbi:hypothetical protein AB0N23_01755 [Streptomyces sp. NPDC052644]